MPVAFRVVLELCRPISHGLITLSIGDACSVIEEEWLLQLEVVPHVDTQALCLTLVGTALIGGGRIGMELLGTRQLNVIVLYPLEFSLCMLSPSLVLLIDEQVDAAHAVLPFARWHVGGAPFAIAAWSAVLVHVVHGAVDAQSRVVGVAHSEKTGKVAFVKILAKRFSTRHFRISYIALVVLPFQLHVHHEAFLLHILTVVFAQVGGLAVGLHLLHSVGRQVVEHHLVVAFEEVLPVEQQFVNLLTMHQDATIVFQLYSV